MNPILEEIREIGILPAIAFNSVDEALPLCRALKAGGIPAAEVTFRTECAEECIRIIHEEMPEMLLGAGTVLSVEQADRALDAGASFLVTPGFNPEVVLHALERDAVIIPGIATPSEIEQAMALELECVKFFPAEQNGGAAAIKAFCGPYKNIMFLPTGGVNGKNHTEYLAIPQVLAVSGTWLCPADKIKAEVWDEILTTCRTAVDAMLGLELGHLGLNCENEQEASSTANQLAAVLGKGIQEIPASFFVGNKEFEVMKAPGQGTKGHIAIKTNHLERAIYHFTQRGFTPDFNRVMQKNGKLIGIYLEGEIGGFAVHLSQK